jgi:uncharacterized protein (TIGR02452 family)
MSAHDNRRRRNIQLFESALARSAYFDAPTDADCSPFYEEWARLDDEHPNKNRAGRVTVDAMNCITAAHEMAKQYPGRCALLNMGSTHSCGGGVKTGASAQEETLCRVSTLYSGLTKARHRYPLTHQGFIVRNVWFFRDEEQENVATKNEFSIDVVTASAARFPAHKRHFSADDITWIEHRVEMVLQLCLGYEAIVLSAFGCGAYHCPPDLVAAAFHKLLVDQGWRRYFTWVQFAILNDHNSTGDTFAAFFDVLGNNDE